MYTYVYGAGGGAGSGIYTYVSNFAIFQSASHCPAQGLGARSFAGSGSEDRTAQQAGLI